MKKQVTININNLVNEIKVVGETDLKSMKDKVCDILIQVVRDVEVAIGSEDKKPIDKTTISKQLKSKFIEFAQLEKRANELGLDVKIKTDDRLPADYRHTISITETTEY